MTGVDRQTEEFVVRCYGKSDLAKLYFPELSKENALKKLKRWMYKCTPLMEEITHIHYEPTMKSFTAREVRLIAFYLGTLSRPKTVLQFLLFFKHTTFIRW